MSAFKYFYKVVKRFNGRENEHGIQKKKSCTWLVKASSLGNNNSKQSDPRLAWIMFHKKIIYRDLKHKDTPQATLEIKNLNSPPKSYFSLLPQPDQPLELNLPGNLQ